MKINLLSENWLVAAVLSWIKWMCNTYVSDKLFLVILTIVRAIINQFHLIRKLVNYEIK